MNVLRVNELNNMGQIFCVLIIIGIVLWVLLKMKHKREGYYYPIRDLSKDLDKDEDIYYGGRLPREVVPVTVKDIQALSPYSSLLNNVYNSNISDVGILQPNSYRTSDSGLPLQLKKNMDGIEYFTDTNVFNFPDTPMYAVAEMMDSQEVSEFDMRGSPIGSTRLAYESMANRLETKALQENIDPLERDRLLQKSAEYKKRAEELPLTQPSRIGIGTMNIERQADKINTALADSTTYSAVI